MVNKQPSMLTGQIIRDGLGYILKGGLRIDNGHLPQANHRVPNQFFGVCVATNSDPATDQYVITQLKQLGIKNARLDFSYADLGSDAERFLTALIHQGFNITLHLLPPFEAAKNMGTESFQIEWKSFLQNTLDRYGSQVAQVEIGNTINRKRWAGFTYNGFLLAWQIARAEIKSRGIKLHGPNIQDFEPIYNIGILKTLRAENLLPDVHTDNLFVERVSEPERFDHRIFKYRWARIFKYNLIKKARVLEKIGQDFDIQYTSSSAAFWAIYRIERLLENGLQKQADYLTRYFTLLAASGALQQANWGALICHREGLIDDGLHDADYPALERIAYYKTADGSLNNYKLRPSFYAMQTLVGMLNDAYYLAPIATSQGLEIHHFKSKEQQIHVAWTINGKLAFLEDIYSDSTLRAAKKIDRDGKTLEHDSKLITETPTYLVWEHHFIVETKTQPKLEKDLSIHAHIEGLQYYPVDEDGWRGLILARNAAEAKRLLQSLHPNLLKPPQESDALRHARNAIWTAEDPRNIEQKITIKQPVKWHPHKAFLDRFKPSKARRSWNGAMELLRRGIATAQPIAYFEKTHNATLNDNFYLCEYIKANSTIGQLFSMITYNELLANNLTPEQIYTQFAQFCHKMHSRGIFFRDFSGGNILVNVSENNRLSFLLIDTARVRSYTHSTPFRLRIADLTRACNKLNWASRTCFMQIYLGLTDRQFTWQYRLPFYLYDLKVGLKRTIGRKGIKRLYKRLKEIT